MFLLNWDNAQHLHKEVLNDQATLNSDMWHIRGITVNNKSVNQTCDKTNFRVKIKIDFYYKGKKKTELTIQHHTYAELRP